MTLARRYLERNKQTKSYFNPINGNFYSEVSKLHKLGEKATFKDAIGVCDTNVLYMLPSPKGTYKDPRSTYPTKIDLESIPGLTVKAWYRVNAGVIQFQGKEFDIHPIGRWFNVPSGVYLSDVILAMEKMRELLEKHFQPIEVVKGKSEEYPVEILSTPARTGVDLLRRKLPYGAKYENLPSDIEHIIMTEFSQARIELFDHEIGQIDHAYLYDGRWMYASCLRHVPIGDIIHDQEDKYLDYIAGFYRVNVTVPIDWHHIGLLPLKNPQAGKGSLYPNQPGETFISWCSDKELALAIKHEWKVTILERILWPQTQAKGVPGRDPLRHWGETLVKLGEIAESYKEPFRSMLKGGFRSMLLFTIGTLHRSQKGSKRGVDGYAESLADLPDGDFTIEDMLPDGSVHYTTREDLASYQLDQFLPHWPLYIWCTAKRKVTEKALEVPYENLLAIRTDGIWTTCSMPFQDTGKVGCFREKELACTGPFEWPHNNDELVAMMRIAKGEE
jgi:hypothetical protein